MKPLALVVLLTLGLAGLAHGEVEYVVVGIVRDGSQTRAWGHVCSSSYAQRPTTPFEQLMGLGSVTTECTSRVVIAEREIVLPGTADDAAVWSAADAALDDYFPDEVRIHGDGSRHGPGP